jgi:hypothetical protein
MMIDSTPANNVMLIKVIYIDNSAGVVTACSLEQFIKKGKIVAFRRLEGWAKIGRDPVRGSGGRYEGPERRIFKKK